MRLKVDIQRFDEDRIIFWFSKGFNDSYINAINDLAMKEEWSDVLFATLDDDRVALVCRPVTAAKIFDWDTKKNKVKYPEDFKEQFLREANQAMYGDDIRLYVEKLTKDEEELKKALLEEALEFRQNREDKEDDKEDLTWEGK